RHLLDLYDARGRHQHGRNGDFEGDTERKEEEQDEVQVIPHVRQHQYAFRRRRSQERDHEREYDEVRKSGSRIEEHDAREHERNRKALFVLVQPRGDERPRLIQDVRHRQEHRGHERELERHQDGRDRARRDHLRALRQPLEQRQSDEREQLVLEDRARDEQDNACDYRAQQPLAQLHQMGDQRAFCELFTFISAHCAAFVVLASEGLCSAWACSWPVGAGSLGEAAFGAPSTSVAASGGVGASGGVLADGELEPWVCLERASSSSVTSCSSCVRSCRAMARARPVHRPIFSASPGSFSGPSTRSARPRIRTIAVNPASHMELERETLEDLLPVLLEDSVSKSAAFSSSLLFSSSSPSLIAFRKPFTALPKSVPIVRKRFAPKISSAIARMISSSLNPVPIQFSRS